MLCLKVICKSGKLCMSVQIQRRTLLSLITLDIATRQEVEINLGGGSGYHTNDQAPRFSNCNVKDASLHHMCKKYEICGLGQKLLCSTHEVIRQGSRSQSETGENVKVWDDNWVPCSILLKSSIQNLKNKQKLLKFMTYTIFFSLFGGPNNYIHY